MEINYNKIKYNIEDGFNFYDELNKSLDDDIEYENTCLISGQQLDKYYFKMDCGHKFNYEPLFKEIIIQKFIFKTYFGGLTNEERIKLKGSNMFIKCPYCRSLQSNLLPYYEDIGVSKVYGVNTIDTEYYFNTLGISNMTFNKYNKIFTIGKKCDFQEYITNTDISNNITSKKFCGCLYVTNLDGTSNNYCINHYYIFYKKQLQEQKAKKKVEEKQKKKKKQQKKKKKKKKKKEKN